VASTLCHKLVEILLSVFLDWSRREER